VITIAKLTVDLPDDFTNRITRLGDKTDAILEKALEAGGKVVLGAVRGNLSAVVGKGTTYKSRSTGELLGSLGLSPVKVGKDGNPNIKVGFAEPHSGGVSNAMLANLLEYGKVGQKPKPFLKPAKSSSKNACLTAMTEVLQREMGNI